MFSPAHIFQLPAGRGQFSWLASATKYQTAFSPNVERLSAFSNQPAACFSAPVARDRSGCCGQNRERSLKRAGTPGFSVDDLMWVFNAAWMFGFMQESGGWANKTNWHSSSLRSLSVQIKSGWLKQRPRITLITPAFQMCILFWLLVIWWLCHVAAGILSLFKSFPLIKRISNYFIYIYIWGFFFPKNFLTHNVTFCPVRHSCFYCFCVLQQGSWFWPSK